MPFVEKENHSNSTQIQSDDSQNIPWKIMSIIFGVAFLIACITIIVCWTVLCENRFNLFFFCTHKLKKKQRKKINKQTHKETQKGCLENNGTMCFSK